MPAKRAKPIEVTLKPTPRGLPVAAYVYPDEIDAYRWALMIETRTVAMFYNDDWAIGMRVYTDAHESIWTAIYAVQTFSNVPQPAPVQHDTIAAAIEYARKVVAV